MTRIGIIREAILAEGGNYISGDNRVKQYYADGPSADPVNRRRNETVYKIDKAYDGLTHAERERVVERLREHPEVKTAYLSRKYDYKAVFPGGLSEGHIKVVFQN